VASEAGFLLQSIDAACQLVCSGARASGSRLSPPPVAQRLPRLVLERDGRPFLICGMPPEQCTIGILSGAPVGDGVWQLLACMVGRSSARPELNAATMQDWSEYGESICRSDGAEQAVWDSQLCTELPAARGTSSLCVAPCAGSTGAGWLPPRDAPAAAALSVGCLRSNELVAVTHSGPPIPPIEHNTQAHAAAPARENTSFLISSKSSRHMWLCYGAGAPGPN